jgi:hypothetical protein
MMLFPIHKQLVKFKFLELEAFITHSRNGMSATWKKFSKEFNERTAGWSEDEIAEYVDQMYDDIAMLRDESPQLLRHAQAMVVYGSFEHSMANLCRAVHRDGKVTAALPKEIHLRHAERYLHPALPNGHAAFATDWGWMDDFRIIRDWMAHNAGKVQKDTTAGGNWDRAKQFLRRNRGMIKFASLGDILVEDAFTTRVLGRARGAIDRVHQVVGTLYR